MALKAGLPMGIENFQEMRIKGKKVNLFTRPRRFGKTLNISMLKYFFEIDMDSTIERKLLSWYCDGTFWIYG